MQNIQHLRSLALTALLLLLPTTLFAQTAITWENKVLIDQTGTSISKTDGANELWDSTALSQQTITTAGTFTWTVTESGHFRMGLSNDTATDAIPSHYFQFFGPGTENATIRTAAGGWVSSTDLVIGDNFSLTIAEGGGVTFQRNGSTVYTAGNTVTLPVKLKFSAIGSASTINNATITTGGGTPPPPPPAGTSTVCAANCTYTSLQTAVNAASAGSTIIIQDNFYHQQIELPAKTCAANNSTCYITIRSGVSATGVLRATSEYPVANQRICPSTRSDCATFSPFDTTKLGKIQTIYNNVPVIKTLDTGSSASKNGWWKLQWVEVVANAYGGNALIVLSNDTATLTSHIPSNFLLDQIVVRGLPITGQFRGMQIDANNVTVQSSYFYDIKAVGEGQVIWANTSRGPITITNNYLNGAAETFLSGGSGTGAVTNKTIQASPAPTTTVFTLNSVVDLYVGLDVLVSDKSAQITAISGNQVTVSPALPTTPASGTLLRYSTVIDGLTVTRNTFTRPIEWYTQQVIIPATTSGIAATPSTTGGSLAAGTYYYRVSAFYMTAAGSNAYQRPSVDVSATVASGTTGSVTVTWPAVANATGYRIHGRQATNLAGLTPSQYWEVGNVLTFTDTGAAGTGHGQTTQDDFTGFMFGSKWQVKNTFEMKQGKNVLFEGNIVENSWPPGQVGQCLVFTPTMQMRDAPSAVIRNVTVRYNVMRKCQQSLMITGSDALGHESGRSGDFNVHDNLFYDMGNMGNVAGSTYFQGMMISHGGETRQSPNRMPYNVTMNHNTIHSVGNQQGSVMAFNPWDGTALNLIPNLLITNNLAYSGQNGIYVVTAAGYTTGALASTSGPGSLFSTNVLAGGANCGSYTGATALVCPTVATVESGTWTGSMLDGLTVGDFVVKATSPYYQTSLTSGKSYGADISLITPHYTVAESGNNTGAAPPPVELDITTNSPLPSGYVGQAYSHTMAATGGTAPYTWAITSGTIPTGLSLNASTGALTGTPTTAVADRSLTFRVTDSAGTPAQVSESKLISIIRLRVRPNSIGYTHNKAINFGPMATAPNNPEYAVKVGDTYFDTTTGKLMVATAVTTSSVTWAIVGG